MTVISRARKELHCPKWRPYMARRLFSKPICAKEERNGPPSAKAIKVSLKLSPETYYHAVCTLLVHPPTSPYSTLSAGAKSKSQRHCRKSHHKLKFVWCLIYASITCNQLIVSHHTLALLILSCLSPWELFSSLYTAACNQHHSLVWLPPTTGCLWLQYFILSDCYLSLNLYQVLFLD